MLHPLGFRLHERHPVVDASVQQAPLQLRAVDPPVRPPQLALARRRRVQKHVGARPRELEAVFEAHGLELVDPDAVGVGPGGQGLRVDDDDGVAFDFFFIFFIFLRERERREREKEEVEESKVRELVAAKKKSKQPISLSLSLSLSLFRPSSNHSLTGSRHALGNREPAGTSPGDDEVDEAARRVEARELEIVVLGVLQGRSLEKAQRRRRRRWRIGDDRRGDGQFRPNHAEQRARRPG